MSMTMYERDDRPVREPEDPRRAAMARRALSRWALRLALREWKQRVLIVVADRGRHRRDAARHRGRLGDARHAERRDLRHRVRRWSSCHGSTPHLPAVIAKIEKAYGTASVVYDQPIADRPSPAAPTCAPRTRTRPYTQAAARARLRHLPDPGRGRSRSRPGSPSSTACGSARPGTSRPAPAPRPAASSPSPASSRTRPTCSTSSPSSRPASSPARTRCGSSSASRLDSAAASAAATSSRPARSSARRSRTTPSVSPATIVLVVSVLGLVFIGLVATAAFTVMAQRRQRALGMLSSLGATEADVRFVLIIDGLIAGVAGAVIGAAAALGGWFWYYPHLETATAHRTDPLNLPWAAADHRPAAGRRHLRHRRRSGRAARSARSRSWRRSPAGSQPPQLDRPVAAARPDLVLAAGLFALFVSGGPNGGQARRHLGCSSRAACRCVIAAALLAPFFVDVLSRLAWRAPLASTAGPARPGTVPVHGRARRSRRSRSRCSSPRSSIDHRQRPVRRRARLRRAEHGVQPAHPLRRRATTPTRTSRASSPRPPSWPRRSGRRTRSPPSCTPPRRSSSTWRSASNVAQPGQPTQNHVRHDHRPDAAMSFSGLLFVATPALLKAFGISPSAAQPGR